MLTLLIGWLKSVLAGTQIIYADLLEANILPVADLFNNYRPDIAIVYSNSICTLELTVCHETNVPLRKYPMYFTCEFHVVLCEAHVEHTEKRVFHMFCPKYT